MTQIWEPDSHLSRQSFDVITMGDPSFGFSSPVISEMFDCLHYQVVDNVMPSALQGRHQFNVTNNVVSLYFLDTHYQIGGEDNKSFLGKRFPFPLQVNVEKKRHQGQ